MKMSDSQIANAIRTTSANATPKAGWQEPILESAAAMERLMRTFTVIATGVMQCSLYADDDGEPQAEHALRAWAETRGLAVEPHEVTKGAFSRALIVHPRPRTRALIQVFCPRTPK